VDNTVNWLVRKITADLHQPTATISTARQQKQPTQSPETPSHQERRISSVGFANGVRLVMSQLENLTDFVPFLESDLGLDEQVVPSFAIHDVSPVDFLFLY
jgi:hypothetical protein